MTDSSIAFHPDRLTLMRERRGWSIVHLAQEASIAERAVRQYERGDVVPQGPFLERLAAALDAPTGFFFGDPIPGLGDDAATFRAATKLPAYRKRAALASGRLAMYLADWIAERFDLPSVEVPDLDGIDPELAAESVRAAWGLGERPAPNMVHLLESQGVLVFALAEDCRELDAFAFWRHGRPFVMLNTMKSGERGRYDAAHELAHLVLHRQERGTTRAHEADADTFASAFLMPRRAMLATGLRNPTLPQVLHHKQNWRVSASSFVRRLNHVGLISEWHYRNLMIELTKRGYRSGEPDGIQRESSQLLVTVMRLLREEGTTMNEIARDLRLDPSDLNTMFTGLTPAVALSKSRRGERSRGVVAAT